MRVIIRAMEVVAADGADSGALAEIFVAARQAAMPWLPELHDPEGIASYFATVVADAEVLLVRDADAPVGFLALRGDMIEHLYVRPEAQRAGIGTALVAAAKARRPEGLELWVFQRNDGARAFYAGHGFAEVERTDGARNEEREPDMRLAWSGI